MIDQYVLDSSESTDCYSFNHTQNMEQSKGINCTSNNLNFTLVLILLSSTPSLPSPGNPPLPNPYGDTNLTAPVMPVQQLVAEILFVRTSYVKKIIEDCSNSEETVKLLRFSCWENPQFSSTVLSELLWQVNG